MPGAIDPAAVNASSEVGFSVGVVLDLRLRVLVFRLVAAFVVLVLALEGDRSGKSSTLTSWINPPTKSKSKYWRYLVISAFVTDKSNCMSIAAHRFFSIKFYFVSSFNLCESSCTSRTPQALGYVAFNIGRANLVLLVSLAILLWLKIACAKLEMYLLYWCLAVLSLHFFF